MPVPDPQASRRKEDHLSSLTPADDSLHPPPDANPAWTETCWFSFDQPGINLSATIYPFFRANLNICSMAVYLWDPSGHNFWDARYGRSFWHLPMPATDLTDLSLNGLRIRRLEPLKAFQVSYDDGERLSFDLRYVGLREPHEALVSPLAGHFDQPCSVTGTLNLDGEAVRIDCLGMRDRTWSPRPDSRSNFGTAYTYGNASADAQFLAITRLSGNVGTAQGGLFNGYLVRDGVKGSLVRVERRVVSRGPGYPLRLTVQAEDEHGRTLQATGTCLNRFANPALAGTFAWMSMVEWEFDGTRAYGEDQEVWSPDLLGRKLMALGAAG